jgi:hypothetical protein
MSHHREHRENERLHAFGTEPFTCGLFVAIWNLELGIWNLEPGTWNLELGTWNLEPGTWNLEPGTCDQF